MTHIELIQAAAKWLSRKCSVVITELATSGETPDAIGWHGTKSTLIECKASREDFMSDKNKPFRRDPCRGIGGKRYYMTIPGIIKSEELPPKWGLLEYRAGRVCVVRESEPFDVVNYRQEIGMLLSTIRRIGGNAPLAGVSIRCYTITTKNKATLTVGGGES